MVAAVNHARGCGEVSVVETLQQPPDIVIDKAHQAEVGGDRLAHLVGIVEALVIDLAGAHRLQIGVAGALAVGIKVRPRHLVLGIKVVPAGAGDQREVRAHERDEQHPRLCLLAFGAFRQPILGGERDPVVVALIGRIAAAGVGGKAQSRAARRWWIAQHADRIADPVHHMQRHVLLAEAIVILGAAEVQFADGLHAMARRL